MRIAPELLAVPFGLVIGLIVGAVGGGGAILALPVLVYVLGEDVGQASTASLIVVAIAAAVGSGALALRGHVCWRMALTFACPAGAGSIVGSYANAATGPKALVLAFIPIMLVAAAASWRRADATDDDEVAACPPAPIARILVAGTAVGALTGFFGVGGGFLIVPVLTLWLELCFRRAVATSLVIITLTGLVALTSHLAAGAHLDVAITASLAGATAAGALAGTTIAQRLPQAALGRAFAVIVASVAGFLLVDTLLLSGPPNA